ncbi:MAG: ribosome small subunit-dependent GTPase A [Candidatus Kapaibacterium sp.]
MADYDDEKLRKSSPIRQSRSPKRILIKEKGKPPKGAMNGRVTGALGKFYLVEYEESGNKKLIECFAGGTIISPHKKSSLVAVADNVKFIKENIIDSETGLETGFIVQVEERQTILSRKAPGKGLSEHVIASNIDKLMIIMSVINPVYNKKLIDRYLISAEAGEVRPAICINKTDLADLRIIEEDLQVYKELGAEVFFISALENRGIDEIRNYLKDDVTLISGPSGVGKSTLVNLILGEEIQAVQDISERTGKGIHTTSFVKLFSLPSGGEIIDSPGIREFGIFGIEPEDIPLYFHDFDKYFPECKFTACTHTHEPGCAVKQAVEEGKIDPERYESYLNLYFSLSEE